MTALEEPAMTDPQTTDPTGLRPTGDTEGSRTVDRPGPAPAPGVA